jgi:hypothetical protein
MYCLPDPNAEPSLNLKTGLNLFRTPFLPKTNPVRIFTVRIPNFQIDQRLLPISDKPRKSSPRTVVSQISSPLTAP